MPMQWLPRSEHSETHCYFCKNASKFVNWSARTTIQYEMVNSVIAPEPRTEDNAAPYEKSDSSSDSSQDQQEDQAMNIVDTDMDLDAVPPAEPAAESAAESTAGPSKGRTPSESFSLPSTADSSSTFQPNIQELISMGQPMLFSQADFNNLVRDLNLSEKDREILG